MTALWVPFHLDLSELPAGMIGYARFVVCDLGVAGDVGCVFGCCVV